MVKIEEFKEQFVETFSFLFSQELAKNAPKDTGTLAKSFPATVENNGDTVKWTVPDYFLYVEFGTIKQRPNPFFRTTLQKDADKLVAKTISIINSK